MRIDIRRWLEATNSGIVAWVWGRRSPIGSEKVAFLFCELLLGSRLHSVLSDVANAVEFSVSVRGVALIELNSLGLLRLARRLKRVQG